MQGDAVVSDQSFVLGLHQAALRCSLFDRAVASAQILRIKLANGRRSRSAAS
jgi:hypothetical protein